MSPGRDRGSDWFEQLPLMGRQFDVQPHPAIADYPQPFAPFRCLQCVWVLFAEGKEAGHRIQIVPVVLVKEQSIGAVANEGFALTPHPFSIKKSLTC